MCTACAPKEQWRNGSKGGLSGSCTSIKYGIQLPPAVPLTSVKSHTCFQMVNRGSTAAGEEMDKLDRKELLAMLKFGADRCVGGLVGGNRHTMSHRALQ